MRRPIPFVLFGLGLLAIGLLGSGCTKPTEEAAPAVAGEPTSKIVTSDLTPVGMAKAMDLPLYPGSEAPGGLSTEPVTRPDGSVRYSLVLATSDAPPKVLAWYGKTLALGTKDGLVVGHTKSGHDVMISATFEAGRTLVRLKSIVYPAK